MNGLINSTKALPPKILWQNSTIPAWNSKATIAGDTILTIPNDDGYTLFAIIIMNVTDISTSDSAYCGLKTYFFYADVLADPYEYHMSTCSGVTNKKGYRDIIISNSDGLVITLQTAHWNGNNLNTVGYPLYIIGLA